MARSAAGHGSPLLEDVQPEAPHVRRSSGRCRAPSRPRSAPAGSGGGSPKTMSRIVSLLSTRAALDGPDGAVQPDARRQARREVEVRRADADRVAQQVVEVQRHRARRRHRAGVSTPLSRPLVGAPRRGRAVAGAAPFDGAAVGRRRWRQPASAACAGGGADGSIDVSTRSMAMGLAEHGHDHVADEHRQRPHVVLVGRVGERHRAAGRRRGGTRRPRTRGATVTGVDGQGLRRSGGRGRGRRRAAG